MYAKEYLKQLNPNCKRDINKLHDRVENSYKKWGKECEAAKAYFEPIVDVLISDENWLMDRDVLQFMPECPERNLLFRKIAIHEVPIYSIPSTPV